MSEHNFPGFNNNGCSLGELINATPFRFWCYKVLPLTYDDSLSYYEVLCKYMDFITKAADDIKHIEENQHCLLTFVQNMQNHMNQFIADYNENITRIDEKDAEQDRRLNGLDDDIVRIDGVDSTQNGRLDGLDGDIARIDAKNTEQDSELTRLENAKVNKAGDTMTGDLTMANSKVKVNCDGRVDNAEISCGEIKLVGKLSPDDNTETEVGLKSDGSFYMRGHDLETNEGAGISGSFTPAAPDIAAEYNISGEDKVNLNNFNKGEFFEADVSYLSANQVNTPRIQMCRSALDCPVRLSAGSTNEAPNVNFYNGDGVVKGLAEPVNDGDAANKGYVDTKTGNYVLKAGDTMTGNLDMGTNKITNVGTPTATGDVTNKTYVDQRSVPVGGTAGQVLSKVDGTDFNTQWVDQSGGGGLQPIDVTRESAYISTPENNFTTKVIADPTAPPERPINKDQIAVYSETNQTYAEDDVTGTLLVADPHSAMEAVNKRTLDGYLSKANNGDGFERVTTSKGLNPGTENYHILSNSYATAAPNRIPVITSKNEIGVDGIRIDSGFINGKCAYMGLYTSENNNREYPEIGLGAVINTSANNTISNGASIKCTGLLGDNLTNAVTQYIYNGSTKPVSQFIFTESLSELQIKALSETPSPNTTIKLVIKDMNGDNILSSFILHHDSCSISTKLNMLNNKITGVENPTDTTDVCNKAYVDNNFIKVDGTPREGSTIAYIDGKWSVVDHSTWTPLQ